MRSPLLGLSQVFIRRTPARRKAAASFGSLLPLLVQFGIATAEEVDVDTLADRVRQEVAASKCPLALPVHVTAWAQLPG